MLQVESKSEHEGVDALATKIRLARHGSKKRPFYWIVVANSRSARDGAFIEKIGVYDPRLPGEKASLDLVQAQRWLKNGAQPTDRVAKLFEQSGIGKATKRFNVTKGEPKAKAKERLGDQPRELSSIKLVELTPDDLESAKHILRDVLAVR